MSNERFNRNELLFGREGQQQLQSQAVVVIGIGGLGTHIVQQLSLLGVKSLSLIDSEKLEQTNMNRYIGVCHDDKIGDWKVDLGERLAHAIDPEIKVTKVYKSFVSREGFDAICGANWVFGNVDTDGARCILNEVSAAYGKPYIDSASDVQKGCAEYGGRVFVRAGSGGCIYCMNVIDVKQVQEDFAGDAERQDQNRIYGIKRDALGRAGPSVVSINGVVASLAVTEYMVHVTGMRQARRHLEYYGHTGKVVVAMDAPPERCYYCRDLWGKPESAELDRYIRE